MAYAEEVVVLESPVGCLIATQAMSDEYASDLSFRCMDHGTKICSAQPDKNLCLTTFSDDLRRYTASMVAVLPAQVDGNGFKTRRYRNCVADLQVRAADLGLERCLKLSGKRLAPMCRRF